VPLRLVGSEMCIRDSTTGSTKRVVPILAIDGQKIGSGERGPVAKRLYEELVKSEK
jgi:branched-subunit amino acid aminotransferase/4-amino-4-deoxychorismate lyase